MLVSPIIEACPTDHKESAMSLLHSFYCWGHVGVVLISTIFFTIAGIANWKILTLIWAVIPVANMILFTRVPIYSLNEEGERGLNLKELFAKKIFWLLMLMMLCAGASEQAVSQWRLLCGKGLGVSKTVGDLAGPMSFAFLMGIARLIYGKYGERMNLERFMKFSTVLCIISYVCIAAVPYPVVGLIGCACVAFLWASCGQEHSARHLRRSATAERQCLPCLPLPVMWAAPADRHWPDLCPVPLETTCMWESVRHWCSRF